MNSRTLLLILISISLLTACGKEEVSVQEKEIPFELKQLQANLTQKIQSKENNQEDEDFQKIIESLKKQSHIPNITEEELERGWYYAEEGVKKYATPDSWVYEPAQGNESGRWIHPDLMEKQVVASEELLCKKALGTFVKSCNELETGNQCEYIEQSTCQCPEGTLWDMQEGCLKVDADGIWLVIQQKELEQGYYSGLNSEKKKGTPESWLWNPEHGIWHSPHLLDLTNL